VIVEYGVVSLVELYHMYFGRCVTLLRIVRFLITALIRVYVCADIYIYTSLMLTNSPIFPRYLLGIYR